MVFETINESSITEIRDLIERAVLFYEPRISLEAIEVLMDDPAEGRLDIRLEYSIRMTNTRSNLVYPFYFLEASHVRT